MQFFSYPSNIFVTQNTEKKLFFLFFVVAKLNLLFEKKNEAILALNIFYAPLLLTYQLNGEYSHSHSHHLIVLLVGPSEGMGSRANALILLRFKREIVLCHLCFVEELIMCIKSMTNNIIAWAEKKNMRPNRWKIFVISAVSIVNNNQQQGLSLFGCGRHWCLSVRQFSRFGNCYQLILNFPLFSFFYLLFTGSCAMYVCECPLYGWMVCRCIVMSFALSFSIHSLFNAELWKRPQWIGDWVCSLTSLWITGYLI